MWCPETYMSLAEIGGAFASAAERRIVADIPTIGVERELNIDTDPSDAECEAYVNWLMWRFLELFATKIRVATPAGAVLRVSPSIFFSEIDDPFDSNDYGGFPETRKELLRASEMRPPCIVFGEMLVSDSLPRYFPENVRLALRPLANFPLCIQERELPTSVDLLIDRIVHCAKDQGVELDLSKASDNYRQRIQRVIEAWDKKEIYTKGQARELFGKAMKTEEWRAMWSELAKSRPEASKPGPRTHR